MGGPVANWPVWLTSVLLLVACAAPSATPSRGPSSASPSGSAFPSATASAGPTESAPPSASPSPTAVATASPTVSPTAAAGGTLLIKWVNPTGASGLEGLSDLRGYAHVGIRYVIAGKLEVLDPEPNPELQTHDEAAIWWSDNATAWHLAQLPEGYATNTSYISGVAAGGPGFVAVGGGLPLWSTDGIQWVQGTGSGLESVGAPTVGAAADGLIAIGTNFDTDKTVAVQSNDGKSWASADAAAQLLADASVIFVQADVLTAFARKSTGETGQTTVYRVGSVGAWQEAGTINDWIDAAALGPHGWAAVGKYAWVSPNAASWTKAPTTPIVPLGSATAAIADVSGFVVSTSVYPPGCAIDEAEIVGYTWTSVDGLDWHKMKLTFQGRWQNAFFIIDRTLVGVGQSHDRSTGDIPFGFVRTADLPANTLAGPPPTPVPTPTPPQGCGP
jgi:hypothetical protein